MTKTLYGNRKDEKLRDRELENGFITYRTLAEEIGGMVLCNNFINEYYEDFEIYTGSEYYYYDVENDERINPEDATDNQMNELDTEYYDFYQFYIINGFGARILEKYSDETVFYNNRLDLYLWAVDHIGTSWDYVFTDIPISK